MAAHSSNITTAPPSMRYTLHVAGTLVNQESLLPSHTSGSSHTSDLKIGTPVATLPGAWRYRVSAGTGRPGVSILRLGEMESLVCNFYLSVVAHKIEQVRP